ncbi:hypothetical protein TIFTF001_032496 [Ficus carica]|uniref:Bet v I/Major latex protein domain-containing protein n=1 Tax=Ficus carica TaxID=3494 RepID=A0AA88DXB2_FICCA|nr:hypothetical protein TIFTF001_032496 [Ficus carica]
MSRLFITQLKNCTTCAAGQSQLRSAKIRVDELDEEKCVYNHSLIEGDALMDKLEYIYYDVKFEPTPEGGSKNKVISKFHTKDGVELNDDVKEELKARKDRALVIYKAVEAYLVQNPDAYA